MRIAIYGGSFNPPHLGHIEAAKTVSAYLRPDRLLIIPAGIPPHKDLADGSPTAEQRLELCRIAFGGIEAAEVSDVELRRAGKSYTCDTVRQLREELPDAELTLVVGTDMLECFEEWYQYRYILANCKLAVLSRAEDDGALLRGKAAALRESCGAEIVVLPHVPVEASSERIRERLPLRAGEDLLSDAVYAEIIRRRLYGAKPELTWLRARAFEYVDERRLAHVIGCENEAVSLAEEWGEDPELAAEAGILHDITKRCSGEEQLNLCEKYGIIIDNFERNDPRLLHARTGAALARELFGVGDEVYGAIRWHTTGKPDMSVFEKIIYLADYIEPTRDFPGIEELRILAEEDLDRAMALGLKMTIDEVQRSGREVYHDTLEAYEWYNEKWRDK